MSSIPRSCDTWCHGLFSVPDQRQPILFSFKLFAGLAHCAAPAFFFQAIACAGWYPSSEIPSVVVEILLIPCAVDAYPLRPVYRDAFPSKAHDEVFSACFDAGVHVSVASSVRSC